MYKIKVFFENNQVCVNLSIKDKNLRKWQGSFAQLIIKEFCDMNLYEGDTFFLCRQHFLKFLQNI